MPSKCAILSCPVYATSKEYKLFRIPAVRSRGTHAARQQMMLRRSRWTESCGLIEPPPPHTLICARHFVSGKPAKLDDVNNIDWVPTLNLNDDGDPGTSSRRRQAGSGNVGNMAIPGPQIYVYPIPTELREIGVPLPPIMSTTTTCCVPTCVNQRPEWVTNLPQDKELQSRWLTAIQVGSGQPIMVAQGEIVGVCNMHFAAQAPPGAIANGYREPTLFLRDNVLMQVASCRLCLSFDTADNMYNMKLNLSDGHSLQWMAKNYFAQFLSYKEYNEEGFFCERCTVRIDMTHDFCLDITENAQKFKWLLRKMANEKVEFGKHISVQESLNPIAKQERFILPKPSAVVEQPFHLPPTSSYFEIQNTQKDSIILNPNELNMPNIKTEPSEDTDIQVDCDPGLYDSSSDAEYDIPKDISDGHNQSRQAEAMEYSITEEEPRLTEPEPLYLTNPPPLTKQLLFRCYLCQVRHESKNSLIHHLMMDHQDHKSLHCEECNVSFQKITVFNKHLGMHDPVKRLKCSVCPLRFRKSSAKSKHEASRHGLNAQGQQATVKDKTKKHQCSQCDKAFVYISELERHEKFKHQGEAIARCEICDKAFASVRNLTRHLKLHREEDEKPKSLTTRTATEIRCNLCELTVEASREMVSHLEQVHPDAEFQTYPCTYCNDLFFSPTSLANHNNIHTDVYGCDLCGKRHYSKMMLQRHRHAKHGILMDDDQYRMCPVCERRLIKGTDYTRHLRTHEKETFICETCGKKFREREQLRIHERTHTHEKPMECVACGARFGSPASLCRHKKICSKIERQ